MGMGLGRRYALVVATLVVVYWLVPAGLGRNVVEILVGLVAMSALMLAAHNDRAHTTAWHMFGIGGTLILAGDCVQAWYRWSGSPQPYPSLGDLGYLLGYGALSLGWCCCSAGGRSRSAESWTPPWSPWPAGSCCG